MNDELPDALIDHLIGEAYWRWMTRPPTDEEIARYMALAEEQPDAHQNDRNGQQDVRWPAGDEAGDGEHEGQQTEYEGYAHGPESRQLLNVDEVVIRGRWKPSPDSHGNL